MSVVYTGFIRKAGLSPALWGAGLAALALGAGSEQEIAPSPAEVSAQDWRDIRQCQDGKEEAYRRLVERHQAQVSAMMWRFSRDRQVHTELVQEVFVEAYLSLAGFRGQAPFAHWLARIATRVGYRYWKHQARERQYPTLALEEWDQLPATAQERLDPAQAADLLETLLHQLPARDRLVLMLRFVEDHSVEETAQLTGWSQTMVKVQTWRACAKLKKIVKQSGMEVEAWQ